LILHYLIPTRILRGKFPQPHLLSYFPTLETLYTPIIDAIIRGDVGKFDSSLDANEDQLIQRGTFLTVERARFLCIRNLFKRVYVSISYMLMVARYLLKDKSPRISIPEFAAALQSATKGEEEDDWNAEVECMLANLMDKGFIRGYLSHERQTAVLAKEGAFPKIEDVK
jgi:hypothetical protein